MAGSFRKTSVFLGAFLALGIGTAAASEVASTRDLAAYFSGKTVELIAPSPPGGGYDATARMLAKHIHQYLPGKPKSVVRNVPGAGGNRALEHTMRAAPDGLRALSIPIRHILLDLSGQPVQGFSIDEIPWVGAPNYVEIYFLICGNRGVVNSWEDVLKHGKPLLMGSESPGSRVHMGAHFIDMTGGPIRMVWGYPSTGEQLAAMYRGETQISTCLQRRLPNVLPELVKEKRLVPLFYWNGKPSDEWVAELGGPQPRHLFDLPGLNYTPAQRTAFEVAVEIYQFFRIFMLRPGTPEDLHQAWVKAFRDTLHDATYLAEAKASGYDPGYGSPEQFLKTLELFKTLDADSRKLFRELVLGSN